MLPLEHKLTLFFNGLRIITAQPKVCFGLGRQIEDRREVAFAWRMAGHGRAVYSCVVVQCTVRGFPRARSILGAAAAVAAGAVTRESLARSE